MSESKKIHYTLFLKISCEKTLLYDRSLCLKVNSLRDMMYQYHFTRELFSEYFVYFL